MTLTDEEIIRMKAVEISFRTTCSIMNAYVAAKRPFISDITSFFNGVDEIVEYVKTGKKPVQIKEE